MSSSPKHVNATEVFRHWNGDCSRPGISEICFEGCAGAGEVNRSFVTSVGGFLCTAVTGKQSDEVSYLMIHYAFCSY